MPDDAPENTPAHRPPARASDEATSEQLKMAREQGRVLGDAAQEMMQEEATGEAIRAGDYVVGYAVEEAEGMYHSMGGRLMWHDPAEDENLHVEVVVRDGADGRFIPTLDVTVTVLDPQGNDLGTHEQPFMWYPWLYHYGRNWVVPSDGAYTIRVHIEPPSFMRHDRTNGLRYQEPVDVVFEDVKVETGRKVSPAP
jgi:hypothetical protein